MTVCVGFVGSGGRTEVEMLDLSRMPDVEIAALCDLVPERCSEAVKRVQQRLSGISPATEVAGPPLKPQIFTDVSAMLDQVNLDAVYVSLPPFAHGEIEHTIVDAGKALFVEKPVALTMSVAREIAAHVRAKGIVTSIGYQMRYSEAVAHARSLLEGVPIGLVIAIRLGGLPPTPWWRVQARSGGMLIEQHTHGVDLCRYLAGEIESVTAFANTALLRDVPDLDIDDVSAASIRFRCGAVGTIANSCALSPGQGAPPNLSMNVHLLARELTLTVSARSVVAQRPERVREEFTAGGDPNFAMNEAFIHAVSTGDRSRILADYDDGVKTFEVTYAAHLSSQRGGEVVQVGMSD